MPACDDGAGGWPNHLECRGGGDRQWRRLHAGTRLRRLAGSRTKAGVDRGSHDPGQGLQARQQISTDTVRAGRARRAGAAAKCGDAGLVALDRAGIAAAAPQHAGDRARQQACPHRLGGSRTRSLLSAEHRRHLTSKLGKRRLTNFNIDSFPAEIQETGCQNGPSRPFR